MICRHLTHFEELDLKASRETDVEKRQTMLHRAKKEREEWEEMLQAWVTEKKFSANKSRAVVPRQAA